MFYKENSLVGLTPGVNIGKKRTKKYQMIVSIKIQELGIKRIKTSLTKLNLSCIDDNNKTISLQ